MAKYDIRSGEELNQSTASSVPAQPEAATPPRHSALFNRPPRILRELPQEEVELPSPPQLPAPLRMRMLMILAPLLTSGIYLLMFFIRGTSGGNAWMILPIVGISLVTAGISIYNYRTQQREHAQAMVEAESSFTEALNGVAERIEKLDQQQYAIRNENDPDTPAVFNIIQSRALRLWERRPGDDDFMCLRIGIGEHNTRTMIKLERSRHTTPYTIRLQKLRQRFARIRNVPRTIDLRAIGSLGIVGPHAQRHTAAHALLWHIFAHHSAEDVRVFAFWNSVDDKEWSWLQFVPHTQTLSGDSLYRLLAHTDYQQSDKKDKRPFYLEEVLGELQQELNRRADTPTKVPHLVVLLTDYHPGAPMMAPIQTILERGPQLGASAIFLVDQVQHVPGACGAYLDLMAAPQLVATTGHAPTGGRVMLQTVDQADAKRSDVIAQSIAQIELAEQTGTQQLPRSVRLFDLFVQDSDLATLLGENAAQAFRVLPNYDPHPLWSHRPITNKEYPSGLRAVPIGKLSSGADQKSITYLDLNERQEGVHGMIAGTTGSGKSELLTTLLLGLALLHHPDRLNFMLIDFKGGATFQELARLPHTAGYITDLSGSQAQRALTAINSELDRRKQRFGAVGVPNIRDYRFQGHEPIPNLLIAIDEFDEMVNDHEEVVEELIRVAKQGRSLGVHLLFATQQPSNNKIKAGLKANLTYWLSLRVVDPEDSKIMIGNKEAALISNTTPGRAFKRVDKNGAVVFQSALATAPYRQLDEQQKPLNFHVDSTGRLMSHEEYRERLEVQKHSTIHNLKSESAAEQLHTPEHQKTKPPKPKSEAEILIEVLHHALPVEQHATQRFRIWEPPLRSNVVLGEFINLDQTRVLSQELAIPLGYIDNPRHASKEALLLDLYTNGSLLMIGSAGSGKTSALRTCMLGFATLYAPTNVLFYVLDHQGHGLGLWPAENKTALLPHMADRMSTTNTLKIERLLTILDDIIRERATLFQTHEVDNLKNYHLKTAATAETALPALLLIIDGLQDFAEYNPESIKHLTNIIRTGHAYGVYVVATVDRLASSLPTDLRNSIPTRWILRVNTEDDSNALLNKPFAARIDARDYGRGYIQATPLPREFQIAFPSLRKPDELKQRTHAHTNTDNDGASQDEAVDLSYWNKDLEEPRFAMQQIIHKWRVLPHVDHTIQLLPSLVEADMQQWQHADPDQLYVPLGIDNRTQQEMGLDLAAIPHLLFVGGPASGKMNVLRAVLASLVSRYTPDELRLFIVDYRDNVLLPFTRLPHMHAYATDNDPDSVTSLKDLIETLKQTLALQTAALQAQAADPLAKQQPHQRIVVVLANIDLIDTRDISNPHLLDSLTKWVIQGQRIGVHFLVAARDYSGLNSRVLKLIKQERSAVVLGPVEQQQLGQLGFGPKEIVWPASLNPVPGRGFLVQRGHIRLGQFWYVDPQKLQTHLDTLYPVKPQTPADADLAVMYSDLHSDNGDHPDF